MAYRSLEEVTGVGKALTRRDKSTRTPFTMGRIEDEVSVSDGEQKYFVQFVRLEPHINVESDETRYLLRIGYYTRRTDGWFCLGSQMTPIVTPAEFRALIRAVAQKGWLDESPGPAKQKRSANCRHGSQQGPCRSCS